MGFNLSSLASSTKHYKAQDKYHILVPYNYGPISILNFNGDELHSWNLAAKRVKIKPNGNFIRIINNLDHRIFEHDWNGKVIWKYRAPGFIHHDFEILDDNGLMFWYGTGLDNESIDEYVDSSCLDTPIRDDILLEINKNDEIKWEWHSHKNITDNLKAVQCDSSREKIERAEDFSGDKFKKRHLYDWMHPNSINIFKENKWFSGTWYRRSKPIFKPGNILITARHLNKIMIIDKDTKKIVWTYGGDDLALEHPHEAEMIPKGFPGAGNILIFDNGDKRGYSRILEINPATKRVVWRFGKKGLFFSRTAGSYQRLKNGDTFISADQTGHMLIVNKKNKLQGSINYQKVWL